MGTSGGRNAVASDTLNSAAFAPIPRASVATAASVKSGAFAQRAHGIANVLPESIDHSVLSAVAGSMRDARRAGMYDAASATANERHGDRDERDRIGRW